MPSPKIKIRKKPTNKRCQDGYPCKTTCISRLKNCRNLLNGQAATLNLWLKHQEEMLEITNKKRAKVGLTPARMTEYGYITAERNFTGKKEAKPSSPIESKAAIAPPVPTPQENIISLGKKGKDGFSTAIVSIGDGYVNNQKQQQKGYLIGDYFISNGLKSKAYYQVQHLPSGMSLANGERLKALTGKADLASAKQIAKKLFDANLTFARKEDTEAFKQSLSDALDVMYDRKPATPNDRADRALEPLKELAKLRIDPEVAAPSPETKQADSNPSSNKELMAKFREALDSNSAIADDDLQQIKLTAPDIVEKYKNVLQIRKKTGRLSNAQLKQLDDLENVDKPAIVEPVVEKQSKGGYESLPDSKGFQEMKSALSLPDDKWEPGERVTISDKALEDAIAASKSLSIQDVDFLLSPDKYSPSGQRIRKKVSKEMKPVSILEDIKSNIELANHYSRKEAQLVNAYEKIKKQLGWAKDRYEKAHTPLQISIRKNSLGFPGDGIDIFSTQKLEKAQSEWDQVKDDYDRLVRLNEQRKQSLMADYNKAIAEVRKSTKNSASSPSPETKPVAEVQSKSKNNGNGSESAIATKTRFEDNLAEKIAESLLQKEQNRTIAKVNSESNLSDYIQREMRDGIDSPLVDLMTLDKNNMARYSSLFTPDSPERVSLAMNVAARMKNAVKDMDINTTPRPQKKNNDNSEYDFDALGEAHSGFHRNLHYIGQSYKERFDSFVQDLESKLKEYTPAEKQSLIPGAIDSAKKSYFALLNRVKSTAQGSYSTFVAGRAKFNVNQANRRLSSYDKVMADFEPTTQKIIANALNTTGAQIAIDRKQQQEALEQQKKELKQQETKRTARQQLKDVHGKFKKTPIINDPNYKSPKHITKDEWARTGADYKGISLDSKTGIRHRTIMGKPVYLTDQKDVAESVAQEVINSLFNELKEQGFKEPSKLIPTD